MTQVLRFTVAVRADWSVMVDGRTGSVLPAPPPLWPPAGPPPPAPGTPERDAFFCTLWSGEMEAALPRWHADIFDRRDYEADSVRQLGRFLFDRLLGAETWQAICAEALAIDDSLIELALRFDGAGAELHRFPWELMYGPAGFLTQGTPPASVTRLVTRAPSTLMQPVAPFSTPPRLLFAVGADLADRRIRPAVEIFGLLRQMHSRGLMANTRALLSASPRALRETINDFKPDLVHFSGHGDIEVDDGVARGYLEFRREDKKLAVHRHAVELLGDLGAAGRLPPVVVLSACHSGVMPPGGTASAVAPAADASDPRSAGVERMGSLAAELVAGGVPVVVGMGGEVADSACRLFTRFFGEALIRGYPLVAALARGRRAAFLDGVPDSADWAYPVLFMAADLDPAYAPGAPAEGQDGVRPVLHELIQAYQVPSFPVFCGRHEFFERYQRLFAPGGSTLPVFARTNKLGRTRLLQELAAQALRDGHLPCWVGSEDPDWPDPPFTDAAGLALEILAAICTTRLHFGLSLPCSSVTLRQVIGTKNLPDLAVRLANCNSRTELLAIMTAARANPAAGPRPEVCQSAIQEDLQDLIVEARVALPSRAGSGSRVVMFFDNVQRYDSAIAPLLRTFIKGFGLGSLKEPVPVILSYLLGTASDSLFTEASETIGARAMELLPFSQQGDEDLLAYEQVLLFPDEANLYAQQCTQHLLSVLKCNIEGTVASFAIRHRAETRVRDVWTNQFRLEMEGIPQNFVGKHFYRVAFGACYGGFLDFGDDEARLRKL